MILNDEIYKYLKGEAFLTNLPVEIGRSRHKAISRESAITKIIKGQTVIHIGCSDHIPIIKEKIKNNIWLHKMITDNSKRCIGIDIDKESIEYVKNELGYSNVIYGNVITDELKDLKEDKWDYVVFGEIIEHLDDPVNFLRAFKKNFGTNIEKFIITVPNIYNKRRFQNMKKYKEIINSDHRYWFTPYTISKVVVSAGYNPEIINYSNLEKLTTIELVIRKIKQITGLKVSYPFYYFNSIIISGRIN